MSTSTSSGFLSGFLAIDVGSSRVKLGWFPPGGGMHVGPFPASDPTEFVSDCDSQVAPA